MSVMMVRHEAVSVSAVRRELALDLDLRGCTEDTIDAVTLVASELVGNAVRHAELSDDGEVGIGWTVSPDEVLITVDDASSQPPVRRDLGLDAPNGRGLRIVEALTSSWGVEATPAGKHVWAKVSTQR